MISVSRLDSSEVFINPDLLREMETTPDTVLTFLDSSKIVVKESPKEILRRIAVYRKELSKEMNKE